MSTWIKKQWNSDPWFKRTIIIFLLIFIIALSLQHVFGENLDNAGKLVAGGVDKEFTLTKNRTYIYSANGSSDYLFAGFATDIPVQYIYVDGNVSTPINLVELQNKAILTGTDKSDSVFEKAKTVSLIIVTPVDKDVNLRYEFRELTSKDVQKIAIYTVGGILLRISFIPIGLYIVIRILDPWFSKRRMRKYTQRQKQTQNFQPQQSGQNIAPIQNQSNNYSGSSVPSRNFCNSCGRKIEPENVFCKGCGKKL